MNFVSETEKRQAVDDVRAVILAANQEAVIKRAVAGEKLYASDEATFVVVETIPVESVPTPADDLSQKIDATVNVLPTANVFAKDHLTIGDLSYRVQSVRAESWFGVVTHQVLSLVKLHGC
jgi:hypothetical protein